MKCPGCQSPDIRMIRGATLDGRPTFLCAGCSMNWTYGMSGGEYAVYVEARQAKRKDHEPNYIIDYVEASNDKFDV